MPDLSEQAVIDAMANMTISEPLYLQPRFFIFTAQPAGIWFTGTDTALFNPDEWHSCCAEKA